MSRVRAQEKTFMQRHGWRVFLYICIVAASVWLWFSGTLTRAGENIEKSVHNLTADAGFVVRDVLVEGRKHTDPAALRDLIDIKHGDPLFMFDMAVAKTGMERLAWIESVHIERRLPDTIYIRLVERTPVAFWQRDKKLALIDVSGKVITEEGLSEFGNLPILVGLGAPDHAAVLLRLLAAEPEIFKRVEAAIRVSRRRWDLEMDNGVRIKLPENDLALAIHMLARMQTKEELIDKNIVSVDLRIPEKLTVQTTTNRHGKNI